MAPTPDLTYPPGSATYASNTLNVGDGTWDSTRNTFLLPNLVGLNFATMQYNGMGNRFRDIVQYHQLIRAHGAIAALTFIVIVPMAIMTARFHYKAPSKALKYHIWLQVLTVALSTAVFILGWFAVGKTRSLTNPHHGIGLAIYVMILVQAIGGRWIYSREKGRERMTISFTLFFHRWLGRIIALLGLAQIPLGLTLYGSPKVLFILYALAVFVLFLFYFVLSYKSAQRALYDGSDYGTGTVITERREDHSHGGLGKLATAAAAGAGIAAMRSHRSRSRGHEGSRTHGSYIEEEKITHKESGGGFMKKLVKGGAILGGIALAKKFMDRGKTRRVDEESLSEESISRVEGGHRHSRVAGGPRRSYSGSSRSSRTSVRRQHSGVGRKVGEGVATLGALGLLRAAIKGRRERKEQKRIDEIRAREIEEQRIARKGERGKRYTGDGLPSRRLGRRGSLTATDITGEPDPRDRGHHHHHHHHGIPPAVPAAVAGAVAGAALAGHGRRREERSGGPVAMPPAPPDPQGLLHHSSGSEEYISSGGRHHTRHHSARDTAAAGAAAGVVAAAAGHHNGSESGVASPPVSVKVKMHSDGRKVTLRRLSEAEAAAERDFARRDRSRSKHHSRHRRGSGSEFSAADAGKSSNWRRVEELERRQAAEAQAEAAAAAAGPSGLIPPPPIPAANVGSPGTYDGTGSEATGFDDSRRRRRAERARRTEGSQAAGEWT